MSTILHHMSYMYVYVLTFMSGGGGMTTEQTTVGNTVSRFARCFPEMLAGLHV